MYYDFVLGSFSMSIPATFHTIRIHNTTTPTTTALTAPIEYNANHSIPKSYLSTNPKQPIPSQTTQQTTAAKNNISRYQSFIQPDNAAYSYPTNAAYPSYP